MPASDPVTGRRILHLLAPALYGGAERVVRSLSLEQVRGGHQVHVAAILDPGVTDHPLLRAVAAGGGHVHEIIVGGREYRRERTLVRQLIERIRPGVVHTHGYRTDVLHGAVARSLSIPTVTTVHGFTGGDWKNQVYEYLQLRAFRRTDAVVVVSGPLRDRLSARGVPTDRIHLIANAWADPIPFLARGEARKKLGIPEDAWCAGFIGRLSREKGPDIFAEAIGLLGTDVLGVMIGDGESRASIAAKAAASGSDRGPRLPGAIEDAGRLMRAFDLLVLSSRTEGTPMVLFEAMAARVPIVATRVGGVPDVVSDREAILVEPENPGALADAIRRVREDPDAAAARAESAAERLATSYDAEHWRAAYDAVYSLVAKTTNGSMAGERG